MNTLMKAIVDLDQYQKDVALQNKEITGLKTLKDACERDNKGDPVEVWQQVIESERMLLVRDVPRLKTQTIIDTIKAALGDIQLTQHQMKPTTSGNCVVCGQGMSMFSKGFACGCKILSPSFLLLLFLLFDVAAVPSLTPIISPPDVSLQRQVSHEMPDQDPSPLRH